MNENKSSATTHCSFLLQDQGMAHSVQSLTCQALRSEFKNQNLH